MNVLPPTLPKAHEQRCNKVSNKTREAERGEDLKSEHLKKEI